MDLVGAKAVVSLSSHEKDNLCCQKEYFKIPKQATSSLKPRDRTIQKQFVTCTVQYTTKAVVVLSVQVGSNKKKINKAEHFYSVQYGTKAMVDFLM